MAAMSEAEARGVLKHYEEKIRNCIQSGWDAYMGYGALQRAIHTSRTRANIIRDHIVSSVKSKFESGAETYFFEQNDGLFCLNIESKLLIKFKKLDEEKNSCNIPTQQALGFTAQMDLPGYPDLTNIIAGYELNDTQTALKCITIVCPNGSSNDWYYDLQAPMADIIPMPIGDINSEPEKEQQKERVKLKNTGEEKERKEENGKSN